jgi:hypothetical protein
MENDEIRKLKLYNVRMSNSIEVGGSVEAYITGGEVEVSGGQIDCY